MAKIPRKETGKWRKRVRSISSERCSSIINPMSQAKRNTMDNMSHVRRKASGRALLKANKPARKPVVPQPMIKSAEPMMSPRPPTEINTIPPAIIPGLRRSLGDMSTCGCC